MENLNAEQIKKALECCIEVNCGSIAICPYREKFKNCYECQANLKKEALSLITSQEQRIKELTEENERLKLAPKIGSVSIYEALEIINRYCESYIKKAKAEIVWKMHSLLCEGRVSNDTVVIIANQIAKEILEET